MTLANMMNRGLGFGYRALGEPARFTLPAPGALFTNVTVIYDVDGAAMLDGMLQSIGPSVRIRKSEAPQGVPRGSLFEIPGPGVIWKAAEDGLPINDGEEIQVRLATVRAT